MDEDLSILDDQVLDDDAYGIQYDRVSAYFTLPNNINVLDHFSTIYNTFKRNKNEIDLTDIQKKGSFWDRSRYRELIVNRRGLMVDIILNPKIISLTVIGSSVDRLGIAKKIVKILQDIIRKLVPVPDVSQIKNVPRGSSDSVTYEDIQEGDTMVDFDDEYKYGRYYKKTTFAKLRNKNPFNNTAIQTPPTYYKAHMVDEGGKRRRKTYRKAAIRKTRRVKKHAT